MKPNMPIISSPVSELSSTGSYAQSTKNLKVRLIVACLVAICGIGFGVFGMVKSAQQESQLQNLKVQVQSSDGKITTLNTSEIQTTTKDGAVVTVSDNYNISLKQVRELLDNVIIFRSGPNADIFSEGLTDRFKYVLSYLILEDTGLETTDNNNGLLRVDITYEQLNDVYHKLFGSNTNVKNQTSFTNTGCGIPWFDQEQNGYFLTNYCGGVDGPAIEQYDILDYTINGKKLVIKTTMTTIYYLGEDNGISVVLDGDNNVANFEHTTDFRQYINQLPKYQFIFEKEDDRYIFTDFKKL